MPEEYKDTEEIFRFDLMLQGDINKQKKDNQT